MIGMDTEELEARERDELNWLRYYYRHVQDGLGPASSDVNYDIMDAYIRKTGKPIPDGYDHREED